MDEKLVEERLIATLSSFFAGRAPLLASVGLYGLMAYNVQRRTREIGIRMSMGARRQQVLWMATREELGLTVAGVIVGPPAAVAASHLVSSMLFGLTAKDPATMLWATGLLTTTGLLAAIAIALMGYFDKILKTLWSSLDEDNETTL